MLFIPGHSWGQSCWHVRLPSQLSKGVEKYTRVYYLDAIHIYPLCKSTISAPWRSRSHYPFQDDNSSPCLPVPGHKETEVPSGTCNGDCSLYFNGTLARSPSKSMPLWKPEPLTLQSLGLWGWKGQSPQWITGKHSYWDHSFHPLVTGSMYSSYLGIQCPIHFFWI